jgi:exodeoxyribonuclease VII small subunit
MKKSESYGAQFAELQNILSSLEQGDVDVDELSEKVKRAAELITFCQSRLRETDVQVKKVIEKFEKSIPVESPEEN